MESIDSRSPFFPRARNKHLEELEKKKLNISRPKKAVSIPQNSEQRISDLKQRTAKDANVTINQGVKDFSKIKRVAEKSSPIDNSDKIARLKSQINAGKYKIDYDAVADKLLKSEF